MIRSLLFATALLGSAPLCAETLTVEAGDNAQERLQEALILAEPGDVVALGAGRFALTDGLSLDVDKVTVRGVSSDETILDFSGQLGAGEGLLVTSDDVVLKDFAVIDSKGDGIKSKGADRIVYSRLRVEWSGGPKTTNGAYGIYPVESRDVLVANSIVRGASDAGIYVGQSDNIVVRENLVEYNVAGIEIENSFNADVLKNVVRHNTGGILVFDLPNLPQTGGHNVRVSRNAIIDNNTDNFAPEGNIVASVPTGTGVMVMANRNVEVTRNAIMDHGTTNVMLIAYSFPFEDPNYVATPRNVFLDGNYHGEVGYAPDIPGGKEMATALGGALPSILWDGLGSDIVVADAASAISLGLTQVGQDRAKASPAPADLAGERSFAALPAIELPAEMEEAAR